MSQPNLVDEFIKDHFPCERTLLIAEKLGLCESTVRRIAKKLGLHKNEQHLDKIKKEMIIALKGKYRESHKEYSMSQIQRNIIVGSLLGDASLALYGRSKNAYFREHGCIKQLGYRKWKCEQLVSLDFKLDNSGKLHSPSHPIYTELYNKFYCDTGKKTINQENLDLLDHPIGLACLYMDDGTLVIDSSGSKVKYLFPRISIYTLCFTQEENELLRQHIQNTFNISLKLKKRPDGKNYILELNRRNEVLDFIEIVRPYVSNIPCMMYKVNLDERMKNAAARSSIRAEIRNKPIISSCYSQEQESIIISLKKQGKTDIKIAGYVNRSYWGIVDKIRRMREEGKI